MQVATTKRDHIFLVEDDLELASLVKERLENEGFRVDHAADGLQARDRILADKPDLVILDVMLPGMDGFEICRHIRPTFLGPILILTARDEDVDQVLGLELGADDFVIKPVRPRVLLARIRALLRRVQTPNDTSNNESRQVHIGPLEVDASRREALLEGTPVDLTTIEFDLLWQLVLKVGQVVSRQDLYQALYNYDYDGLDRTVDVYVSRLRQKLADDPSAPHYIKTVRGVGYLLAGERA